MNEQLISVIIPVYNGERFLKESIDSVFNQKYKNIEVIVVDDGSTDKSAQIAKSYADVRYLYQTNQGPSVARNTGIEESTGNFISFIDCDDIWYPEKLKVQIEYLNKHSNIGFVFAHRRMKIEKNIDNPPWYKEKLFTNDHPVLGASAILVRRKIYTKIGGYNPNYRFGENAEWLTRAKDAGVEMTILPKTLLELRVHERNQTYHLDEMRSNILKALKGSIDRQREKRVNHE